MKLSLIVLAIVAVAVVALIVGNYLSENGLQVKGEGKPTAPLDVNLKLSPLPTLNQEATLTLQVKSLATQAIIDKLNVSILLPKGIDIVSGNLEQFYYDISENETIVHTIKVRVKEMGDYKIIGGAIHDEPGYFYGKGDKICFSVRETGTTVISCDTQKTPVSPFTETITIQEPLPENYTPPQESPYGKKR